MFIVTTMFKYCQIYSCKRNQKPISIVDFIKILKQKLTLEEMISRRTYREVARICEVSDT